MSEQQRQRSRAPHVGWVLLGLMSLATLTLAPLLPQINTALLGSPIAAVDGWQHTWHLWWVAEVLRSGQNPFVTPLLFHPQGASLYIQPLNLSTGVLMLPVTVLVGPVAAYNLAAWLSLVLGGLAGYLLAWDVSKHPWAALAAGLAFGWAPFHLARLFDGQLELAMVQWPAFYALWLRYALRDQRWPDALFAGALLALVGYTSWYYLLFMLVWSAAYGLLALLASLEQKFTHTNGGFDRLSQRRAMGVGTGRRLSLSKPPLVEENVRSRLLTAQQSAASGAAPSPLIMLRQGLLTGMVALLLLAPALIPALASRAELGASPVPVDPSEVRTNSANLVDFWLPSALHPLWGAAVADAVGVVLHPLTGDWNVALGYTSLVLALVGTLTAWRVAWPWLSLALLGMILALGPALQVGTWRTDLALPYQILTLLPGAEVGRRPLHFTLLTTLALTPLVALGARTVLLRAGRLAQFVALAVLLLFVIELVPVRATLHTAAVHPYYATLESTASALLHVPVPLYKQVEPQRAQMQHGLPIIGGYLARIPPYPLLDAPGIRPLRLMRPETGTMLDPQGAALYALRYYGISTLIVNWEAMHPDRQRVVQAELAQMLPGVAPHYADATLSAYTVPHVAVQPFAFFGPGWHDEEQRGDLRWRWMSGYGALTLVNPSATARRVEIDITFASYAEPRPVTVALAGNPLAEWLVPAQPAAFRRSLSLWLPPGEQTVTFQAPSTPEPEAPGRELSVALQGITVHWPSNER